MTEMDVGLSDADVAQTQGNLNLAVRWISELIARIEADKSIPESGAIVFLPPEDEPDPELTAANLRMAERAAAEGRNVIIWTIGKEEPFSSAPAASVLPAGRES